MNLSKEQISEILINYDLGSLKEAKLLYNYWNIVYEIKTTKGIFILKVLKFTNKQALLREQGIYKALNKCIPMSKYILTNKSNLWAHWNNHSIIIKTYVSGKVPANGYNLTLTELQQLGSIFARIHTTHIQGISKKDIKQQVIKVFKPISKKSREYKIVQQTIALLEKSGFLSANFPQGFIHADLHTENLIIKKGKIIAILDFEESCRSEFIYDLGLSILDTCVHKGKINAHRLASLFKGYESVRLLTPQEKNYLPQATLFAGLYVLHFLVRKNGINHIENTHEQLAAKFLQFLKEMQKKDMQK